jgi:hypothetical protein
MSKFLPFNDPLLALEFAREHSRFHLFYDEIGSEDADRVLEFCRREKLDFRVAPDRNPLFFKISIQNVNFATLEKIDQILEAGQPGH